ncbi:MAG: fibronectin type III domain-containing protein, partial [Intrasporangiaceae bacterium]|nr:fibronectin type III domain-containing protein [Intrasporangiaceae bacterium]
MATKTWYANDTHSWRTASSGGGSSGWRSDNSDVYHGQYCSGGVCYGRYKGCAFFDDADIRSTLSGQNILSISLRLTRRSAGGASAAGTPHIRLHNHTSQPSGEPSYVTSAQTPQSWAWGETKYAYLPTWWGGWLRDGDARGIMLYRAADTPYMIFTTDVRLVITYEPQLTAPNTPGGFSIGTVTTYSAYLSWNSVSTADRYRYTNQQLNPTGSTNDFTTTGTSITNSSGISSNNRYRWRVRAENDAGDSDYTSYIYRTTLPLTPSSVSASPASGTTGETSIDVFWNHIAGTELDRYRVQREGGTTSGATTSSNSHNSTGLNPNT